MMSCVASEIRYALDDFLISDLIDIVQGYIGDTYFVGLRIDGKTVSDKIISIRADELYLLKLLYSFCPSLYTFSFVDVDPKLIKPEGLVLFSEVKDDLDMTLFKERGLVSSISSEVNVITGFMQLVLITQSRGIQSDLFKAFVVDLPESSFLLRPMLRIKLFSHFLEPLMIGDTQTREEYNAKVLKVKELLKPFSARLQNLNVSRSLIERTPSSSSP